MKNKVIIILTIIVLFCGGIFFLRVEIGQNVLYHISKNIMLYIFGNRKQLCKNVI